MKNKIELRGIIVSSFYDDEYFSDYVEKGIIIPESRFRANLAKADKAQDLNLYINSPGGSVFAGSEMINSLLAWKKESGKNINITVGALAASMAANTIVQVGDPERVKVHQNTKIMFHGAQGIAAAGAQGFADYSDLLNKINADVKVLLVQRYNLSPDQVDEWFAEGREGWLSADDAKRVGMASVILGLQAVKPEVPEDMDSLLNERGVKLAAAVLDTYNQNHTEVNMWEKIKAKLVEMGLIKADSADEEIENVVAGIKTESDVTAAVDAAKAEAKAEAEKQIAEIKAENEKTVSELTAKVKDLETNAAADKESITDLTEKLADAEKKNKTLSGPGTNAQDDSANGDNTPAKGEAKAEFFAAVKEYKEEKGCDLETATLQVARENKELHAAMLKEAK